LYETENVPVERKTIYRRYQIRPIGFYWLIAELDPLNNLAFGYANLNSEDLAEWGYISVNELLENGAVTDKEWEPCSFREALKKIEKDRVRDGLEQ